MANILRKPMPSIAEVHCSRLKFQPGDRILVTVYARIDRGQEKKLKATIAKWAGCEVEVLIINGLEMNIDVRSGLQLPGGASGR